MSNFDPNAILRGAQLTFVGANRALLNPHVFKHEHYRHAALAVLAGILIRLILEIPVLFTRSSFYVSSFFVDIAPGTLDVEVIETLNYLQHSVLQVPFFLMNLMKFLTPAIDDMFMDGLRWVDQTYTQKHQSEDPKTLRPMYYPNLKQYTSTLPPKSKSLKTGPWDGAVPFFNRYARRALVSLTFLLLSHVPYFGKFILPLISFYTFDKKVGNKPAIIIFASGLFVPRKYFVIFLQTYFASRSMVMELLEPYFSRIHFNREQKRQWFLDREGVLFGFGVAFFLLVKIPYFGVLIYGIAEASTAYLITKITDAPPEPTTPEAEQEWIQSQLRWKNKKKFMELPVDKLDALNVVSSMAKAQNPLVTMMPSKKFT